MFYNLILDGQDVDVNALMLQLEQEVQHDFNVVIARDNIAIWQNYGIWSMNLLLKGTKISRFNQTLLLKTYVPWK
jgi:hypothetical protein